MITFESSSDHIITSCSYRITTSHVCWVHLEKVSYLSYNFVCNRYENIK